jgi:hypothetical protein
VISGTANVLGALALAVSDRMADGVTAEAEGSHSRATALSALHHFLDDPSIDRVREVLGLTHSGTVRVLDELAAGLLTTAWTTVGATPALKNLASPVRFCPWQNRGFPRLAGLARTTAAYNSWAAP